MSRFALIFILILALFFGYSVYRETYHQDCGLNLERSRARVLRELKIHHFSPIHLKLQRSNGSCAYHFKYKTQTHDIDYYVFSSWKFGTDFSFVDNNRIN